MKIHGNIEGRWRLSGCLRQAIQFPWMKIHGNIEGIFSIKLIFYYRIISMNENSWQHWRIEYCDDNGLEFRNFHEWKFMATLKVIVNIGIKIVNPFISMNENSWQHWRVALNVSVSSTLEDFHEWKFMATLKELAWSQHRQKSIDFHEWKFMATLKVVGRLGSWLCRFQISMNENSWQHWRMPHGHWVLWFSEFWFFSSTWYIRVWGGQPDEQAHKEKGEDISSRILEEIRLQAEWLQENTDEGNPESRQGIRQWWNQP